MLCSLSSASPPCLHSCLHSRTPLVVIYCEALPHCSVPVLYFCFSILLFFTSRPLSVCRRQRKDLNRDFPDRYAQPDMRPRGTEQPEVKAMMSWSLEGAGFVASASFHEVGAWWLARRHSVCMCCVHVRQVFPVCLEEGELQLLWGRFEASSFCNMGGE